jgi:dynein heavy chain
MKGLREYFKDPNMSLENITTISIAGKGLLQWVIPMMNYYGILKIVAPKQNAVAAAEKMLNTAQNELERIQAEVYIHGICHKQKKVKTQKLYKRNGNK